MKSTITIITIFLFIAGITSFAQTIKKTETPIEVVNRNFKAYISTDDNSPSASDRNEMTKALKSLQQSCNNKDLPLLINVWMYYDATDFPTRELVEPILIKHKTASLAAIDDRMKHKKSWEETGTAPYDELIYLKTKLSK